MGDLRPTKPWAVLAYTVADDQSGATPLDAAAKIELKALCDAADFDRVSVAAQVDFKRTRGVFRGTLTEKPRDFEEVNPDDHPLWRKIRGGIRQSKLKVFLEKTDLNAARADVLGDFLTFCHRECEAARYVVFFYGHAYGPMGLFYDAATGQREANTMRLNELASSIAHVDGRAAVVVFRDCFMNTLETAYQLRTAAEFMIASQAVMPVAGVWPWQTLMSVLMPSAASADVAQALAMQLAHFLDVPANRTPFADVPFSLLDLGAAETIVDPLRALASALDAARADATRRAACAAALEGARVGFPDDKDNSGDPALLDVPTLCDRLQTVGWEPVSGPARALGETVRTRLVRSHYAQLPRLHGTSVYYKPVTPRDVERSFILSADEAGAARDADYYAQLALSDATGWHRIALSPLAL